VFLYYIEILVGLCQVVARLNIFKQLGIYLTDYF